MERQFKTNTCGAKHGVPDKEDNVAKLIEQYIKSKLHTHVDGRKLKGGTSDKASDFLTAGATNLEHLNTIKDWFGW
jgi:hypothetical protein